MNFILSIVHSPDASPTSRVNAKAVSWSMTRISSFLYKIGVWLPSVGVVDQHIEGDNFRGELSERRRNWISQRPGRISRSLVFRSEIQPETPLDSLSNYQLINRLHELGVESNEGRLRRRDIQNGSKLRGEKLETQTIRSPRTVDRNLTTYSPALAPATVSQRKTQGFVDPQLNSLMKA